MQTLAITMTGIGYTLLLVNHALLTVLNKPRLGYGLSAVASTILGIAFVILESLAFVCLNIAWGGIAVYGLYRGPIKTQGSIQTQWCVAILGLLVLSKACLVVAGHLEATSWLTLTMSILMFTFLASKSVDRFQYAFFGIACNLLALPYQLYIGNISAVPHSAIILLIFVGTLKQYLKLKPESQR
ncbi:hypothetical protein [Vibrio breoganii]|uniref:hypothetical protein n=1 Tax=Vibrio breoganii TaxID=553239 RepID=UPI000C83BF06|nr:hypothetical protein [Vibrio breoganii]PML15848.1 hypothetical protein BCT84_07545 [Vibrio breoganii]